MDKVLNEIKGVCEFLKRLGGYDYVDGSLAACKSVKEKLSQGTTVYSRYLMYRDIDSEVLGVIGDLNACEHGDDSYKAGVEALIDLWREFYELLAAAWQELEDSSPCVKFIRSRRTGYKEVDTPVVRLAIYREVRGILFTLKANPDLDLSELIKDTDTVIKEASTLTRGKSYREYDDKAVDIIGRYYNRYLLKINREKEATVSDEMTLSGLTRCLGLLYGVVENGSNRV